MITLSYRIGAQFVSPLGHLPDSLGPIGGVGGPDVKHFQSAAVQSDFIQEILGMGYPFFGSEISFQEMAVAHLSAADQDGIRSGFKGF